VRSGAGGGAERDSGINFRVKCRSGRLTALSYLAVFRHLVLAITAAKELTCKTAEQFTGGGYEEAVSVRRNRCGGSLRLTGVELLRAAQANQIYIGLLINGLSEQPPAELARGHSLI
jgi:hypothetical protein